MNDTNLNRTGMELDLGRLMRGVKRIVWLLVLALVLGAAGFALGGYCLITPQYQSSVVLYVNNAQEQNVYSGDLTTSRKLVDSILVILNTRETMLDVIGFAGVNHSLPRMEEMISATAVNGTEFFRITVTSPDLYEAERIANAIGSVLPEHISSVLEGSSAKVIDPAVIASRPSTPDALKCAVLGALLGLGGAFCGVVLTELFDDTIRTPEELLRAGFPPVLAELPGEEGLRLLGAKLALSSAEGRCIGILGEAESGLEAYLQSAGWQTLVLPSVLQALEHSEAVSGYLLTVREGSSRLSGVETLIRELEWTKVPVLGMLYFG